MLHSTKFVCKTTAPLILIASLAACGGSSTSSGGSNASTSFENIIADGTALADEVLSIPFTDPSTLPLSGDATYNGFIAVGFNDNSAVAGDLQLIANFRDDEISGSASNFFDDQENAIGGELEISNSFFDRGADTSSDFTFGADLDGTLTSAGENIVVDAILNGDFTGSDYDYVEGSVFGTATNAGESSFFDGEFVAER